MDEFPPIRAIVFDLDGTLLNSSKMISDRNKEAVRQCSERGIHLIVATARPPRAIDHLTEDLKFVEHVVYYNGALVVNKNKGIRRHTPIPAELAVQIVGHVSTDSPGTFITYEVDDSWYCTHPLSEEQYSAFGIRSSDSRPQVMDMGMFGRLSPTKIVISRYTHWHGLAERFEGQANIICTDNGALVQVMENSVSKEFAIKYILTDLEIVPSNVMAFGDDYNDLGLFKFCGLPVAMSNAIDELKGHALFTTESNDNDGVALALERFILN